MNFPFSKSVLFFLSFLLLGLPVFCLGSDFIELPRAEIKLALSIEEALSKRHSLRSFAPHKRIESKDLAQVLWAMVCINREDSGKRTHPSAMAKYTVDVYVAMEKGLFKYEAKAHELQPLASNGDVNHDLRTSLPKKDYVKEAPVLLILVGDVSRLPDRFPENLRWRWIHCEAGAMAQNLYLQSLSLGLGTCINAGFDAAYGKKALGLESAEQILYILPLGYPER